MRSAILIAMLLVAGSATAQTFEPFQILPNPIVENSLFGYSVANLGDVDGNGFNDYAVGAPGEANGNGGFWIVMMESQSTVLSIRRKTKPDFNSPNNTPPRTGTELQVISDKNGDEIADLLVWSHGNAFRTNGLPPLSDVRRFRAYSPSGIGGIEEFSVSAEQASFLSIGDVNDDGLGDFLGVSQDRPSSRFTQIKDLPGYVSLFLGTVEGFRFHSNLVRVADISSSLRFGYRSALIGDLDGDGMPEVALSGEDGFWIISINSNLEIGWQKHVTATSLGLSANGEFGRNLTSLDPTGELGHLLVASPGNSDEPGSLHVLGFGSSGEVTDHDIIPRSAFPAGNEFDLNFHFDLSVQDLDRASGEYSLLLGTPYADVRGDNTGAIHKLRVDRNLAVTPIFSFSNRSPEVRIASPSFEEIPRLIGDLDGNGFPDLVTGNTVHFLGANTEFIGERSLNLGEAEVQLEGIGDLNSDGVPDIIVTPRFASGLGQSEYEGWAQIRFMNRDGTFDRFTMLENVSGNIMDGLIGESYRFGHSSVNLGDIDGDGVNDLAISAPLFANNLAGQTGYVFIVFMQADGEPKGVARIAISDGDDNFTFGGMHLTAPGNINGDGVPDLAVGFPSNGRSFGATERGAVHVLMLSENGGVKSKSIIKPGPGVDLDIPGSAAMGWLESVGDLDRDGVPDLIMGPGEFSTGPVRGIYVLFLNADGSLRTSRILDRTRGPLKELFLAASVAGMSPQRFWDIDGDGVDEIMIDYVESATNRRGPMVISLAPLLGAEISPIASQTALPRAGDDYEVRAEVRSLGGSDIEKVEVNFRIAGQDNFLGLPMELESDVTWSATIPGFLMSEQGLEYFFSALAAGRAEHREPVNGIISVPVTITTGIESVIPSGVAEDGYHLISVPMSLENPDARSVLESSIGAYEVSSWRFFQARTNLAELNQTAINLSPGSAYWMIARNQQFIDWGAGTSVPTDSVFAIQLPAGWSAFGSPFNFDIDPSLVATKSGSAPDIRRYNGAWEQHPDSILIPFEGYAIFSETGAADTLFIAPSRVVADLSVFFEVGLSKSGSEAGWSIPIHARMGRARDIDNVAVLGSSLLNRADPPPIGNYVRFAFKGGEYPLSTAASQLDGDIARWTFNISSEKAGSVSVQFPDLSQVPAEYAVTLVDPATGYRQDLRSDASYAVASSGGGLERTLQLEVDAAGSTTGELPTELRLYPNFPNPFSASTTLRYSLAEAGTVNLAIYDILGRRISTIEHGQKSAGNHVLVWDGTSDQGASVGPGLYFVRLTTARSTLITTVTRSHR